MLPPHAKEIPIERAKSKNLLPFGAVLVSFRAEQDGERGDYVCTGVGQALVCKKLDDGSREPVGKLVTRYEGHQSEKEARETLQRDLKDFFVRRYGETEDCIGTPIQDNPYEMCEVEAVTRGFMVDEQYGYCFTALCLLTYEYEQLLVKR